ncbi:MAG: DUF5107 domain-containing protein [Verrucomicrobiae bacterium]|nr:DUF5107 domain-containing protein [Verrucomicrobiae bacterium]
MSVEASLEALTIPTYPVGAPEKNPVFFEKRVYQGSNGKVYPLPFIDKVFDEPVPVSYQSARLENEFIRLVMLPEIGGRIFLGQDKKNADYDFFYRQDVIKPALVGLAGPWISGGVEFNWPQHHRPGTFMPADLHIEHEADGAATVWLSEHDPLDRLKGMHGIRMRPGSSLVELRARLYNRTPLIRTFLWWANVAAMVHDQYQSFFPPDVHYVADHAVRALSSFPVANNPYYGVDYQNRPGANDLSWYRNIPVPTSYMVCQTAFDFFGGYDHAANGGFVHVADRHVAPGKKQWTWGNHPFGWAWDRELTDANGPYVELMAGVYTDNQPDFTYLLPYETKTFSQFWWPIRDIGPVQQANTKAALALAVRDDRTVVLGLNVSERFEGELVVSRNDEVLGLFPITLNPGEAWTDESLRFSGDSPAELLAELRGTDGSLVLDYRPVDVSALTRDRAQATEPPAAEDIDSADELYFTAEHLEQYRHTTRDPEPYLLRCLEIDPLDARANLALGKRHLARGRFAEARGFLEKAVGRLTFRHPNPVTGEAHYHLGLTLRFLSEETAAEGFFAKAAWNYEWRSSSHYQLATLACRRGDFEIALRHLDESLATNRDHNKAKVLQALVLHRLGKDAEALEILAKLAAVDPLDHWAAVVADLVCDNGIRVPAASRNDGQTILDLVFDFIEAGFADEALALLEAHHASPVEDAAVPNPLSRSQMTRYVKAWLTRDPGDLAEAGAQSPDHFFPSRLEEMLILEWAAGIVAGASSPVAKEQNMATGLEGPATSFTPTFLHPEKEIEKYNNQLPHWQQEGVTYAVTFRLDDSLPQSVLQRYVREKSDIQHRLDVAKQMGESTQVRDCEKQLHALHREHIETALDQGTGACHMRDPRIARIVADALTHFDGERYDLAAWCVMPNHVHMILRPLDGHRIEDILASIKSFSAQQANKALGRSGAFWKSESYDHIIRDEDDLAKQLDYLKRNPKVAGLEDWKWVEAKRVSWGACKVAGASSPVARSMNDSGAGSPGHDPLACYGLGNLYYDKRRHHDAIAAWEKAASTNIPQVHRNLAIARWNTDRDGDAARQGYLKAIELDPFDPRLVSEFDQLRSKLNDPLEDRLDFLLEKRELVFQRDDASVSLARLFNLLDRPQDALDLLRSRRFHPWEGGEGMVLREFTTAKLLLGRHALEAGDAATALAHFVDAMDTPDSLGENYHLLQAKADVNYWIGRALQALGRNDEARQAFEASASEQGDFSEMAVTAHSPLTWFRGRSLGELGRGEEARGLFQELLGFATGRIGQPAKIDYFATSLPNLLVFEEDLQARRDSEFRLLAAMAHHGLGNRDAAIESARLVLGFDRADPYANLILAEEPLRLDGSEDPV